MPGTTGQYDETTLELINHSHSLCEIMYVCEGGMSIETEAAG